MQPPSSFQVLLLATLACLAWHQQKKFLKIELRKKERRGKEEEEFFAFAALL